MSNNSIIYLDNAATNKPYEEVLVSYQKASTLYFANSSSIHKLGQESSRIVELAREQILNILGLSTSHELIFTSGATESNNLAIVGTAIKFKNRGNHIITTAYEHPSVTNAFKFLEENFGFKVTYLSINKEGKIDLEELKRSINEETILVSVMAVNNEIGSINDISSIAKLLKNYPKILFHVDAVQAINKIDIDYKDVDLLTFTSHKIHGLKGIGALVKRASLELEAINNGGGQEKGYRSGTLSNELIISFAKAFKMSYERRTRSYEITKRLFEKVYQYLEDNKDLYEINSTIDNPYILNFSLRNKKASVVVEALSNSNIMVSSISACHSKNERYSHVVKALGKAEQLYKNTIRISFDEFNTLEEIDTFISSLNRIVMEIKQ